MKKILVLAVLFILTLAFSAAAEANKARERNFKSKALGISLTIPGDWEAGEEKDSPIVSLYSPETKQHPQKTLNVEKGIKVELVPMEEAEFNDLIKKEEAKNPIILVNGSGDSRQNIAIYSVNDSKFTYLQAFFKNPKTGKGIAAFGYIPEEKKLSEYKEQFMFILSSLKIL